MARSSWAVSPPLDLLAASERVVQRFKNMWRAFLAELDENAILDCNEAFVDGTFFPTKKGARVLD